MCLVLEREDARHFYEVLERIEELLEDVEGTKRSKGDVVFEVKEIQE